jgi:hypothetical protein
MRRALGEAVIKALGELRRDGGYCRDNSRLSEGLRGAAGELRHYHPHKMFVKLERTSVEETIR